MDDYYTDATLHNKLQYISVPLLCLSAADDPFQPLEAIPIKAAEDCSHVAIVITARGGHIGFLEGWWPSSKEQYMGRLFAEFFTTTLCDKSEEFKKVTQELLEKNKTKNWVFTNLQSEMNEMLDVKKSPSFLNAEQLQEKCKEI